MKSVIVFSLFLLIILTSSTNTNAIHFLESSLLANEMTDLSGVKVALFYGTNQDIHNACRTAMENMFLWMNASVDTIEADDIRNGILYNYDILGFPPGNLDVYTVSLRDEGCQAIRDYVRNGGSYIGISRGAHYACRLADWIEETEYPLQLFNGTGLGPIDGELDQSMNVIDINTDCEEIDLSGLPNTLTMFQWEGIQFIPDEDHESELINVSFWGDTERRSQIAYRYGAGCVFLSGCHPELEEDSDRDGTDYFDHHEDPETDWPLMLPVAKWLVETSTWNNASINPSDTTTTTTIIPPESTTTTTDITDIPFPTEMFILAGVGAVVVIALVIFSVKRR
jgi:glutamine amidotransferase-like uncharacterized protein